MSSEALAPADKTPWRKPVGQPLPTSPWPVIAVGLVFLGLFFGGLGGWAALAPLASAVNAYGTLQASGQNKVVQHLDGGIIKELLVKNGDTVTNGQVLIRLDQTQAQASVNLIRSQYLSLLAIRARLVAERDGADKIAFPTELTAAAADPGVKEVMDGQASVFAERRNMLEGQVSLLEKRVKQLQQQKNGAKVQQNAQAEQLALIQDELKSARILYEKGYVPKTRILLLERQAAALSGEGGEYSSSGAGIEQAIGEAELQMLQLRKERLSEVSQNLSDVQDKLNAMEERLNAAQDVLTRTVITAPTAGIVLGMNANTVGGVIDRGVPIMEIVPSDEKLVIKAAVRPEDIADVQIGMPTEVRLTAYDQRKTGILHGRIDAVSADRIVTQSDPIGHFEIKVAITDDLATIPDIDVVPGMPAMVLIPTKQRTVLEYVVGPLTDYFSAGMREK
ncbi:HlyD family type I secretion periplasmic adaptor subunit [Dongia rigui]|uniref:Membrane fusion protein (MFP) family protein n=1 Tax=Dongia rigui TaxID=940149 RepID=A0ABU5E2R4_9PROT|nr:HlyD family type I secretion periplasmic adaptor subunit [Dongia rigui]MDY0873793.1 HlyD family type I secretion periplasmic adaptor subunit [Dongia rigui]